MKCENLILLDLFSGTGGFPLGLLEAGFTFKKHYFSEIDPHAIANYRYNFKHSIYAGSVEKISKGKIESPDIICFGFPCQDVSMAGTRKGLQGERTSLYFEAIRIIQEFRPRLFIFENVKGLFSTNEGRDFEEVIKTAANLGFYNCQWQLLNSAWLLPQNRERIYFVGCIATERPPEIFPISEDCFEAPKGHVQKTQAQIVSTIDTGVGNGGDYSPYIIEKQSPSKRNYDQLDPNQNGNRSMSHRVYHRSGIAPTQMAGHEQTKIYDGNTSKIRRLTPLECERLQGFPDNWTRCGIYENGKIKELSDTQRYKLMGNAVTMKVVKMVGLRILGKPLSQLSQISKSNVLNGPADTCPSYLRARLLYIERAIRDYEDKQGMGYKTLRHGVIPDEDSKLGDICSIQTFEHLKDYPPLDFMELTRFNTWFTLHPEKVCGKEFVTTSLLFPVSIKGKGEDIVQTIHRFIDPGAQWEKQREQEAELSKLRSKAFRLRIKLLKNRYWQNQNKGI